MLPFLHSRQGIPFPEERTSDAKSSGMKRHAVQEQRGWCDIRKVRLGP